MSVSVPFRWPKGPSLVEVSGDWDEWKKKVSLDRQGDGSFSKEILLPSNRKIHYKYIVDGDWKVKEEDPTTNDDGNVNNIIETGDDSSTATSDEASKATSDEASKTSKDKASKAAAGASAGIAGASAAAIGVASKLTGKEETSKEAEGDNNLASTEPSESEKKQDPAQAIKNVADEDIRNSIPTSISNATHATVPAVAGAIATVTGADILRGDPKEIPATETEIKQTQAEAQQKGDGAATVGGHTIDASKAPTDNAKAAADVANVASRQNNLETPAVAVGDAGFASSVDPRLSAAGKEGGEAAGIVASAGHAETTTSAPLDKEPEAPSAVDAVDNANSVQARDAHPAEAEAAKDTTSDEKAKGQSAVQGQVDSESGPASKNEPNSKDTDEATSGGIIAGGAALGGLAAGGTAAAMASKEKGSSANQHSLKNDPSGVAEQAATPTPDPAVGKDGSVAPGVVPPKALPKPDAKQESSQQNKTPTPAGVVNANGTTTNELSVAAPSADQKEGATNVPPASVAAGGGAATVDKPYSSESNNVASAGSPDKSLPTPPAKKKSESSNVQKSDKRENPVRDAPVVADKNTDINLKQPNAAEASAQGRGADAKSVPKPKDSSTDYVKDQKPSTAGTSATLPRSKNATGYADQTVSSTSEQPKRKQGLLSKIKSAFSSHRSTPK